MWDLVDLPKDCKAIGSRWMLEVKHHSDGQLERHKCKIIAKGYSQINGAMMKLFHLWYDSSEALHWNHFPEVWNKLCWPQPMVRSLVYAAMATRPDIAQAVSVVNPNAAHLTAVKRILRYLKDAVNLVLRSQELWLFFQMLIGPEIRMTVVQQLVIYFSFVEEQWVGSARIRQQLHFQQQKLSMLHSVKQFKKLSELKRMKRLLTELERMIHLQWSWRRIKEP